LTFAQLLRVLRARRAQIAVVLVAIFALVTGVSLLLPETYVAHVTLVAETKDTDPVTGNAVRSQLLTSYLNTQADIVMSRNVALKVVDRYHFADDPGLQREFHERAQAGGEMREWLADRLLGNLEVELSRNSNIFRIAFSARDAGVSSLVANAIAEAYIQTTIELKLDPAKRQSRWFDEQLLGLRSALEEKQKLLADYQRKNTLVTTDGRLDVETARLAGIAAEALSAQTAMSDAQGRRAAMRLALEKGRTAELPDILGNNLLQSMKADLTRAESKLAEVAERYGSNHPHYVAAAAEVDSLRQRLAGEIATARGSIEQATQIAEQRSAEMQAALEKQKQRILELTRANDEREVLSREVESAQHAYDSATQRASSVRLESQLDQSAVAVLVPATQPLSPARPRIVLNAVAALFFGALFGVGLALMAEWRDRRVRDGTDITLATGIVLLAEFPRARNSTRSLGGAMRSALSMPPRLKPA
jgi:succinoglycan biosynthesis transport protein ExoP